MEPEGSLLCDSAWRFYPTLTQLSAEFLDDISIMPGTMDSRRRHSFPGAGHSSVWRREADVNDLHNGRDNYQEEPSEVSVPFTF